jgi:hypothetical protein
MADDDLHNDLQRTASTLSQREDKFKIVGHLVMAMQRFKGAQKVQKSGI